MSISQNNMLLLIVVIVIIFVIFYKSSNENLSQHMYVPFKCGIELGEVKSSKSTNNWGKPSAETCTKYFSDCNCTITDKLGSVNCTNTSQECKALSKYRNEFVEDNYKNLAD
jgi:hypothetical protein